jgi:hypothetical protein
MPFNLFKFKASHELITKSQALMELFNISESITFYLNVKSYDIIKI